MVKGTVGFSGCSSALWEVTVPDTLRMSLQPRGPLCAQQAVCVDSINAQPRSECSCWVHAMGDAGRWEEGEEGV